METQNDVRIELQSNCSCVDFVCQNCHEVDEDKHDPYDACLYCGAKFLNYLDFDYTCKYCGEEILESELSTADDCSCTQMEYEYLSDEIQELLDNLDEYPGFVKITGKNIGWRRIEGQKIVDIQEFFEKGPWATLAVNTEWNQTWRIPDKPVSTMSDLVLTVTQYHHDAPTGETYTFQFLSKADVDDDDE